MEVYNLSALEIERNSWGNGNIGAYAKHIYTSIDTPSRLHTTEDGFVFYVSGNERYLVAYKGEETEISLPESYDGDKYDIYPYAFLLNKEITEISIPNTVEAIGKYAFYKTGYYENEENWQDDVLYIDGYLIRAKTTLSGDYEIEDGTVAIAEEAFSGCKLLTGMVIPESVTSIAKGLFEGCYDLRSLTIPSSVTKIDSFAFSECYKLVEIYNLSQLKFVTHDSGYWSDDEILCDALDIYTSKDMPSKLVSTEDGFVFRVDNDDISLIGCTNFDPQLKTLVLPDNYEGKTYKMLFFSVTETLHLKTTTSQASKLPFPPCVTTVRLNPMSSPTIP